MSGKATNKRKSVSPDNKPQRKKYKKLQIEKTRKKIVQEILNDLQFLYKDLNRLIGDYDSPTTWEDTASTSFIQRNNPFGLLCFQQHLYICLKYSNSVITCNANGEIIKENSSLSSPCAIDIDKTNSMLYIADETHINVLNLEIQCLSSWKLPKRDPLWTVFRGLKVDGQTLYLSIWGFDSIFLCNTQDGKVLKTFGGSGSQDGEFNFPYGLTVDNKYVYICDHRNNRVQIFTKEHGIYVSKWGNGEESTKQGEFYYPTGIYNHLLENLIYVGDLVSMQIFRKDGVCIQRLGDKNFGDQMNQFYCVSDICVMDNRLYVSDRFNKRIQVFNPVNYFHDSSFPGKENE